MLTSRQSGREACAAFGHALESLTESEVIEIDFEGVTTFSPSWGDEFIGNLLDTHGSRLILRNTKNPSVQATLRLLEQIHKYKFKIVS